MPELGQGLGWRFPGSGANYMAIDTDGTITSTELPNMLVQTVSANSTALITVTGTITEDDSIPQNNEGTEVLTVSITPKSSTNILEIEFVSSGVFPTTGANNIALFQDATANALAAGFGSNSDGTNIGILQYNLKYRMAAGTTSSTTFKIRCSNGSGGTLYLNGTTTGPTRLWGGTASTYLTIKEYQA